MEFRRRGKSGTKNVFKEIIAKSFPSLAKDKHLEQTPNRINPNKSMRRHIIIKLLKLKRKKWKAVIEKRCITDRGAQLEWLWAPRLEPRRPEGGGAAAFKG